MDLDNIKGWDWVKRTSLMLEKNTGVKPIPVWHPNRKKRGFEEMCERYPYIAIGTTDIRKYLSRSLTWFTMTAHRYHSKIHGLGYTKISDLDRSGFDSVDSTSWLYANMTGTVYRFHRGMMDKIKAPAGKKVDIRANLCNSIYQWSKLSDYLEGK